MPPPLPGALPLTGRSREHLCDEAHSAVLGVPVHRDVVEPFLRLRADAAAVGFDLQILSGFRDFQQQRSIWNRKATGLRAVLDSDARPLDITVMTPEELVFAILRWSALPGGSRHHWGTDLDVFDANTVPPGYEIELIPEEVDSGGMFGPLHDWLDERMAAGESHGFFRPYDLDRGGVAPERWHLSHGPVASGFEKAFTPAGLREAVETGELELTPTILAHLDTIHARFVINTSPWGP
jgi:LAS superfamily LD-carboxypeptidase LdcB